MKFRTKNGLMKEIFCEWCGKKTIRSAQGNATKCHKCANLTQKQAYGLGLKRGKELL